MVDDIDGVVKAEPVNNRVPPEAALYQYSCSEDVALRVTEPGPHLDTFVDVGAAGPDKTIACTAVLVRLLQLFPASA